MPKKPKTKNLKTSRRFSAIALIVFGMVFASVGTFALVRSLAAGTYTLYLSPASGTVTSGNNLSVSIKLNISDNNQAFNYADIYLSYPSNLLSVSSISYLGSVLNQQITETYDNNSGSLHITRQSNQIRFAGDFQIATVNFTSKSNGVAGLIFGANSVVKVNGFFTTPNILTGTSGGNYTVNSPPSPPPAPPPATPAQCNDKKDNDGDGKQDYPADPGCTSISDNSESPNPTSVQPPAAPAPKTPTTPTNQPPQVTSSSGNLITDLNVADISFDMATLAWTTPEPLPGVLEYGTEEFSLDKSVSDSSAGTERSLTISQLVPGTRYYYKLTVTGASGPSTSTGHFTTVGLPVVLSLKTADNKPLIAKVTVRGLEKETAKDGTARFDLPPGDTEALIKFGDKQIRYNFKVADIRSTQTFTYKSAAKAPANKLPYAISIAILLAGLASIYLVLSRIASNSPRHIPVPAPSRSPAPPPPLDKNPLVSPPITPPPIMAPAGPPPKPHQHFPWLPETPSKSVGRTAKSSIAAGRYVEPEDMFQEGRKRLSKEGIGRSRAGKDSSFPN